MTARVLFFNVFFPKKTSILMPLKDSCYSVPNLGNPWTYAKQGWCYKVWKSIMNPSELLLKLLESNLLGMKLTTDVAFLFLSAVDNYIFVYLLRQTYGLCYVSVRASRLIKMNIKKTFMGNDGFLHYYLTDLIFSERRTESCYSGKPLNLS